MCPSCKEGYLYVQSGPYSYFIGCSNYPDCKCREKLVAWSRANSIHKIVAEVRYTQLAEMFSTKAFLSFKVSYCSFCYLFDTSHFFFLLRKKTPMAKIPNKPRTTGKMSALDKSPISRTTAITIKIIPKNSAIFWSIILHILISPRTLYRLTLKRAN